MTEKEIKKTDVSGKNLEDLTKEELEEIQGQGDVHEDTCLPTTLKTTNSLYLTRGIICRI